MKDQNIFMNSSPSPSHRTAAIMLIAVSVLSVMMMAHHPTASTESPTDFMQTLISIRGLNQLVHGGLIATTLITWLCLIEFSAHDLKQALVRNGILLYSLGTFAMVGAAMTNGFIISRLAESILQSSTNLQAASPLLFQFTWSVNQTLDGFAVITMCTGIACWSIHLISSTKHARLLGVAGLVMASVQIVLQWTQHGNYDIHQMLIFVVWHSLWCINIAFLMLRKQNM
jgi:hypothetical protein